MAEYVCYPPPNDLPCPGLHTCYYGKFFLLRMPVEVNGRPAQVKLNIDGSPVLSYCPGRGRDINLSISLITDRVAKVLKDYDVYHVDTFYYHDVPMFSITFPSEDKLRSFVSMNKNIVEQKIQNTLSDLFGRRYTYLQKPKFVNKVYSSSESVSMAVSVDTNLLLVTPPHTGANADHDISYITPANIHTAYNQWDASALFTFGYIDALFRNTSVCRVEGNNTLAHM